MLRISIIRNELGRILLLENKITCISIFASGQLNKLNTVHVYVSIYCLYRDGDVVFSLKMLTQTMSSTFDNFLEVSFLLEETLGRKVEVVVTPEGLSPHIGPHILKELERVPVVE